MASAAFYRHSGKVSLVGLLLGAVATLVGGPLVAIVYSVAIAYIPFVYLNAILSLLFGVTVGGVVSLAMKWGKVRNTWLTMAAVLVATAFAHYVGWVVWVAVMFFRADAEVPVLGILFPPTFFMIVGELGREGVWSIGVVGSGSLVSGAPLWCVWGTEALLVFSTSLMAGFFVSASQPFCEGCQNWCPTLDDALRLSRRADADAVSSRLLMQDLAVLGELSQPEPTDSKWLGVDLCLCVKCGETNTLTLSHVAVSYDKHGKAQTTKRALVNRMLLSSEQSAWVRGIGSAPAIAPAEQG